MMSCARLLQNPWMNSMDICKRPGRSTESVLRVNAKSRNSTPTTNTCIATALEIGCAGSAGEICSALSTASAGTARNLFRNAVNQSCSCIARDYPGRKLGNLIVFAQTEPELIYRFEHEHRD